MDNEEIIEYLLEKNRIEMSVNKYIIEKKNTYQKMINDHKSGHTTKPLRRDA